MDRQQIGLKLALEALHLPLDLDSFDQRMAIQKTICLCQAAGVHLGYRFNWYLRGPYSPDLTRDAFDLRAKQQAGVEEPIVATLDPQSLQTLERIQKLWTGIPLNQRPRHLELLASVQFLRRSYDGRGKDAAGLRAILEKNDKHFTGAEVDHALKELDRHGITA